MQIFGFDLEPGRKLSSSVKVGELACFADVSLPVLAVKGRHDGPTLWLTGAVHGDELNGPWAMRQLFWALDPEKLHGTLVMTPLLNPMAFFVKNKVSFVDYLDLDQQFPGNAGGSYSERIAAVVFPEMKRCADYVIDFHTMGSAFSATPYTVSKVVPGASAATVSKAFDLARVFGVRPNCHLDLASAGGELPGTTSGSIDITCMKNDIPCFMAEMGGGGRWDEPAIAVAGQGIRNVMGYLDMLPGGYPRPGRQIIITGRRFLRSQKGGVVRMAVAPGDMVKAGTRVATIHDFAGEIGDVVADRDWFMIATLFQPVVTTGDRVGFVGFEWHEADWNEGV